MEKPTPTEKKSSRAASGILHCPRLGFCKKAGLTAMGSLEE